MTAPTINGARYPQPVDALLPAARTLADNLGATPSRNRLMAEFRIGAPKATELRARLLEETLGANPNPGPSPDGPDSGRANPADAQARPAAEDGPAAVDPANPVETNPQATPPSHPGASTPGRSTSRPAAWPVILLALPAFVAVWSGWVGLGRLTGFGVVDLLPGIVKPGSWATIDSAITLPIGVETYAAYALYVWLSGRVPERARQFAKWSAIGSLIVGALGQVAYHLLVAAGETRAPWWITMLVACLPVAVLGMGAALAHLVREDV